MIKAAVPKTGDELDVPPTPIWQSTAVGCVLCGGRRHDYLFVVGTVRMMRCHECGLISRSGGAGGVGRSFLLDADAAAGVRQMLPRGPILQIVNRGGALASGDGREFTTLDLQRDGAGIDVLPPQAYDGALVNGTIEDVADPVALLRRVRAAVRRGGA